MKRHKIKGPIQYSNVMIVITYIMKKFHRATDILQTIVKRHLNKSATQQQQLAKQSYYP